MMFCNKSLLIALLLSLLLQAMAADLGGDFTLTGTNGQRYALTQARGKVVLLAFGYTACPDVCPLTLGTLATVLEQLGPRAAEVEPLFIAVDPARDTPARLATYTAYFHPAIRALTGTADELHAVAAQYGTRFSIGPADSSGFYPVDHSASLYLIDRQGRLAAIVPFGLSAELVTANIRALLDN